MKEQGMYKQLAGNNAKQADLLADAFATNDDAKISEALSIIGYVRHPLSALFEAVNAKPSDCDRA